MPKYHINVNNESKPCDADTRKCPYQHFATAEDAQNEIQRTEAESIWNEYPPTNPQAIKKLAQHAYSETRVPRDFKGDEKQLKQAYIDGFIEAYNNTNIAVPEQPTDNEVGKADTVQQLVNYWNIAGKNKGRDVQETKLEDFPTKSLSHFYHKETEEDIYPFRNKRMLLNPIKRGEKIVIPAGTRYSTTAKEGSGVTKKKLVIKVADSFEGYTDGSVGKRFMITPQVRYAGSGGYWRAITVTPEILLLNKKAIVEKSTKKTIVPIKRGSHFFG